MVESLAAGAGLLLSLVVLARAAAVRSFDPLPEPARSRTRER